MTALKVKNWREFQHYKHRSPPWIRLHKRLLDDYSFHRLPLASRALAPLLWLLASDTQDGSLPDDLVLIAFRLHMSETDLIDALDPLIRHGFILDASAVLAARKPDATTEYRVQSTEKKKDPEAYASDAPSASPGSPLDLKRECWERGKRLMVEKWHIPKSKVGPLLGKWAKEHGFPLVIDALARAEAEAPAEPISFVEGILKHREGMNGAGRRNGNGRADAGGDRPDPGGIVGATLGAIATIRARQGDRGE